jgi:hypothetical protein
MEAIRNEIMATNRKLAAIRPGLIDRLGLHMLNICDYCVILLESLGTLMISGDIAVAIFHALAAPLMIVLSVIPLVLSVVGLSMSWMYNVGDKKSRARATKEFLELFKDFGTIFDQRTCADLEAVLLAFATETFTCYTTEHSRADQNTNTHESTHSDEKSNARDEEPKPEPEVRNDGIDENNGNSLCGDDEILATQTNQSSSHEADIKKKLKERLV